MLTMYPSYNNVLQQFNKVAGSQTGILNATAIPLVNYKGEPTLKSITGAMPNYHSQILQGGQSVQYHLIGYGSHYEEALIKYVGESIERYSTLVGSVLTEDMVEYGTYHEMCKKGKTMPIKYMDVFTDEQIKLIEDRRLILCDKHVTEDDMVGWIKCPSLFNPDEKIYVPVQMLFIGYENKVNLGEYRYIPAFSTGTASHKSYYKAMENAIIEYMQIDAFMLNWYTGRKCKRVIIDDDNVLSIIRKHGLLDKDCPFEIIPLYLTLPDMNLPNFSVALKRKDKKTPYVLVGVQADLDPVHGILRGIMEALPIAQSAFYNSVFYKDSIDHVITENPQFNDLDQNVLFYAMPHRAKEKDQLFYGQIEGEIKLSEIESLDQPTPKENIKYLINQLKRVSEYAVFLDITPPETRERGWYVSRVLVPEILEMCIPDFPFANHPRMKEYGGVKNEYPHPMP